MRPAAGVTLADALPVPVPVPLASAMVGVDSTAGRAGTLTSSWMLPLVSVGAVLRGTSGVLTTAVAVAADVDVAAIVEAEATEGMAELALEPWSRLLTATAVAAPSPIAPSTQGENEPAAAGAARDPP